ncbi:hypothetical protein [Terriglobus albidus]|uniref:hypothetical protein n=1 Tax=Terriglobus albidus TaxID=1592106 RepID=UPI0021DF6D96|nr:hypothetical protein [Terriglobus albidus]
MLKSTGLILAAAAFGLMLLPEALAAEDNLIREIHVSVPRVPFAWPETTSGITITKVQVTDLLRAVDREAALKDPLLDDGGDLSVESYQFTKLDDGAPFLVAVTDSSPARRYDEISLLRCVGVECELSTLKSEAPIDLNRQIVTADQGGKKEILIKRCVCLNGEIAPGILGFLYGVEDGKVRDVSASHREYFQSSVLPDVAAKMAKIRTSALEPERDQKLNEYIYAQREMERRVLGDHLAGLTEAQQWETSPDEDVQALAVATFEKLDSPSADTALERIAKRGSLRIRERAQQALSKRRTEKPDLAR